MKEIKFLQNGLFEKPFMQTRIRTHSMTLHEKLLGFLIGPCGVMVLYAMITQLRELYYTSVIPIDVLYGSGTYLAISVLSTIVGVIASLGLAYMVEHTVSSAGKIRPYTLIGSLLVVVSGTALFFCPFEKGSAGMLIWLFAINVLYNGVALTLWNLRTNLISLVTRNQKDRTSITTMYYGVNYIIPGLFGGFIVSSILYYRILANDTTGDNWRRLILIFAAIAVPLFIIEYFFTRERITEENRLMNRTRDGETVTLPVLSQLKLLFTDKYYILALIMSLLGVAGANIQGINTRTNFCQWVLGATAENNIQMLYLAVAMAPMGFGIFLIHPLAKKMGARNINIVSNILLVLMNGLCMLNPTSLPFAFAGGFLLNFASLAPSYVSPVFTMQANDSIEYHHSFRPEGSLGVGIVMALQTMMMSPLTGLYETVLVQRGYDAYAATQNQNVIHWIVMAWYGFPLIIAFVRLICLSFFDFDKKYPDLQEKLKYRTREAVLARGEEWIDPEEQERRETLENQRRAEADRIRDLRERCAKKGLDFETENKKYLDRMAAREAKKQCRQSKKSRN